MSSQFPISSPCPFEWNKGVVCGSFYCGPTQHQGHFKEGEEETNNEN
jgi:hypothetical protein